MTKSEIESKIKKIIAELQPYVAGHGGEIIFAGWEPETGIVKVSLQGACEGCVMSGLTLKFGLTQAIQKELPQVKEVVPV